MLLKFDQPRKEKTVVRREGLEPLQSRSAVVLNPLKAFPSKADTLTKAFFSVDAGKQKKNIEKCGQWLHLDKIDPNFGLQGSNQEVEIRRSFRRIQSSKLFKPSKHGETSLSDMDNMPKQKSSKTFVLVEESKLAELSKLETILREEQELIGEQCAWVMSEMQFKAHIPVPATRMAMHNLCESEMRRIAKDMMRLNAAWSEYSRQNHYHKPHLFQKSSYLENAPLSQRAMKLKLVREAAETFRLKKDRDTMLFEDDSSFLSNAYINAQIRRRDYDRYFVLASRFGYWTEEEFSLDSRPGKRYWMKATRGALKFQLCWDRYWSVTKLRRHRASRVIQTKWRGYITYKKLHPLIRIRMRVGKNAYLKFCWPRWVSFVKGVKIARELIRSMIEGMRGECFAAWKKWARESKDRKDFVMKRFILRIKNAAAFSTFIAWANWTRDRRLLKIKLRRRLQCPQFELWVEYTQWSKHMKRLGKAAIRIQSIARACIWRKKFRKTKAAAVKLGYFGLVVIGQVLARKKREVVVMREFEDWRPDEEKRRLARLNDNEKRRLMRQQQLVQERERKDAAELLSHLQSSNGKVQLSELCAEIRSGAVVCETPLDRTLSHRAAVLAQAKELIVRRCQAFSRVQERHDFNTKAPPLIRCADPACHTTFASEEQYHTHLQTSEKHRDHPPFSVIHWQMKHGKGLECLKAFLVRRHGIGQVINCLDACIAVSEWRKYMSRTDTFTSKAIALYDNFLKEDSARAVGLDFSGLAELREHMESVKTREFNGCMQPAKAVMSRVRSLLGLPGQSYQKWTTERVVLADCFDELEFQCLLVVVKAVSSDESYLGSEEFAAYSASLAKEAAIRLDIFIGEYKQVRLREFVSWARDFRQYELGVSSVAAKTTEAITVSKIYQLLDECLKVAVTEMVFEIQHEEQKAHEGRAMVVDDALDWATFEVTEEVYEVYVSALLDTMWKMPELRKGMLEYSGLLKKKNKKKLLIDMNVTAGEANKEWFETFMKDATAADKKKLPPDADSAATTIQRIVRGVQGRKKARKQFVTVFVKRFDPASGACYYTNMVSGESSWDRPLLMARLYPLAAW